MKNIRHRKQTCRAPPAQDEWWALETFLSLFSSIAYFSLLTSRRMRSSLWDQSNCSPTLLSPVFSVHLSFPSTSDFLHHHFGPAGMNVDRDRHMQEGQQPCLASGSSPWQQIPMRADNGTRNENNAVCQPGNQKKISLSHQTLPLAGPRAEVIREAPLYMHLGIIHKLALQTV